MKTIGSVLRRLLLALGGSAAENYLNDITLVDRIAELAENGQISSSVIQGGVDLLSVYPVGSIYMSVNSTSPETLFGGTWEQIEDTFLLAAGSSFAAGATGGAATHDHTTGSHKLTVNEMPSHSHKYTDYYNVPKGSTYKAVAFNLAADPTGLSVQATGGNAAHSHGNTGSASSMPPYLAVYMWKRTA